MSEFPPKKLVDAYERGMINGHELALSLIQAAANYLREELLPLVPEELLGEIRRQGTSPPERPEPMRFIRSVCNASSYDHDAWERGQQAAYYDGA